MKFDFNTKHTTTAVYAFLVIACAIIFNAFVTNFETVLDYAGIAISLIMPFIIGFCIAYLLNPLMKTYETLCGRLDKKGKTAKYRRVISVILAYLTVVLLITVFICIISPQIKDSVVTLVRNVQVWMPKFIEYIHPIIKDSQIVEVLSQQLSGIFNNLGNLLLEYSGNSISGILGGVKNVTGMLSNILLGFIISVYMLLGKEKFASQIKKLMTVCMRPARADKIIAVCDDAHKIFSSFLMGKIVDSIIIGVLCTIGMSILRLPFAALVGFIVGVTNVIPYFGAFFGGIIGILIILVVSPIKALWFGIFILVLQQIDGNVIGPRILSSSTGLSAFWVIFAIIIGGGLFGIVGMFLGVPAFALIYALVRSYINKKMEEKQ